MFKAFFTDNGTFQNYGAEHLLTILFTTVLSVLFIVFAKKKLNPTMQRNVATVVAIFILFAQLAKVFIRIELGVFDYLNDLPLHLCNMLPMVLPFALYFKKRQFWAILFLWIMAGTLQSLLTPTLHDSFPHYEYFRYWIVHCGLVMLAIYPIFIYGFKLKPKDIIYAAIAMNGLALVIYFINLGLGSNYMYLMAKPAESTIIDFLGPWPWYILSLEIVQLLLFSILYLPFWLTQRLSSRKLLG